MASTARERRPAPICGSRWTRSAASLATFPTSWAGGLRSEGGRRRSRRRSLPEPGPEILRNVVKRAEQSGRAGRRDAASSAAPESQRALRPCPPADPGGRRHSARFSFLLAFRLVFRVKALLLGLFCCSVLASPAQAGYEEAPADSHREARWLVPMDGPLGSPFGPRWGRMHDGIDIEGWAETRVRAARAGVVKRVGWFGGYGTARREGASTRAES